MRLTDSQEKLLLAHQAIDRTAQAQVATSFISGWETQHDVSYKSLVSILPGGGTEADALIYTAMGEDDGLREKIRLFHASRDGAAAAPGLIIGAGSSPLVCSIMTLLQSMGITEFCYVKPMYHAYYHMAKVLGMRMIPLGQIMRAADEAAIACELPGRTTALVVTDPSWIAGHALSVNFWDTVREWQERTGSLVIVDGTFQYTKWDEMGQEFSASLDPERTLRLVCPTKSLCVHGLRFAYVLLPALLEEELGWIYTKFTGSNTMYDLIGAHVLMDQLMSPENNRNLVAGLRVRYRQLHESGFIHSCTADPNCTYYIFARLGRQLQADALTMSSVHFELDYPDDYVRINLLSPHLARVTGRGKVGSVT